MRDLETVAVRVSNLVLVLLVVDLALGIALERTGIYPGATATATAIAGTLFALAALCGAALLVIEHLGDSRQSSLGEWETPEKRQ